MSWFDVVDKLRKEQVSSTCFTLPNTNTHYANEQKRTKIIDNNNNFENDEHCENNSIDLSSLDELSLDEISLGNSFLNEKNFDAALMNLDEWLKISPAKIREGAAKWFSLDEGILRYEKVHAKLFSE